MIDFITWLEGQTMSDRQWDRRSVAIDQKLKQGKINVSQAQALHSQNDTDYDRALAKPRQPVRKAS